MASRQYLSISQGSQSAANNTSQVRVVITSVQDSLSSYNWGSARTGHYYVSVNGASEVSHSFTYTQVRASTTETLFDETITVTHNSSGEATVAIRAEFDLSPMEAGQVRLSDSITLTK